MFKLGKPKSGSGAPTPKRGEAILLLVKDILKIPAVAPDGVTYEGNYVLKPSATFSSLYMTPSTQDASYESSGDADAVGRKSKFVGMHPGTSKEFMKFLKDYMDEEFIILYGPCETNEKKVMGSPCNPMKLKVSGSDNKDGNKNTLTFEEELPNNNGIMFYEGAITFAENPTSDKDLALDKDNGLIYQLNSSTTAEEIAVTGSNLDHNSIISIIGGGGTAPLTLVNAPSASPAILLHEETDWLALKDAVISLRVTISDKVYLTEVSRK